jgi:hypothetical protein
MTPGSRNGEAASRRGDGIHHLHHVRQNTPSSFAKMLAAELEQPLSSAVSCFRDTPRGTAISSHRRMIAARSVEVARSRLFLAADLTRRRGEPSSRCRLCVEFAGRMRCSGGSGIPGLKPTWGRPLLLMHPPNFEKCRSTRGAIRGAAFSSWPCCETDAKVLMVDPSYRLSDASVP